MSEPDLSRPGKVGWALGLIGCLAIAVNDLARALQGSVLAGVLTAFWITVYLRHRRAGPSSRWWPSAAFGLAVLVWASVIWR